MCLPCLFVYQRKEEKTMDNIRHHNFDIERDVFFFEDGYIKEMYFNPDSSAGGSIVENIITFCQFLSAAKNGYSEDIWTNLEGECRQFVYDIDNESFPYYLDIFQKDGDVSGATEKTFNKILEYIINNSISPRFVFRPDVVQEYLLDSKSLVVTRYDHRLTDIVLHYNAISSPQEFFDRLHAFSKCEKVDIEETDSVCFTDKYSKCEKVDIEETDSVCFTDKYIGGYDRETMIELVVYAQQAEREKDIQKQIDTMIASVRLLTIDLQELAKSVNNRNCCCYCTPSETGYCTDVFSDPESAMEVSLSVGDGAVGINVKFADGREGWLATAARYCPYCGRKIR